MSARPPDGIAGYPGPPVRGAVRQSDADKKEVERRVRFARAPKGKPQPHWYCIAPALEVSVRHAPSCPRDDDDGGTNDRMTLRISSYPCCHSVGFGRFRSVCCRSRRRSRRSASQ